METSKLKYMLIPINNNNSHWSFIAIDLLNRKITYYDSMRTSHIPNLDLYKDLAETILIERQGVTPLGPGQELLTVEIERNFPSQMNGYDCGVFVLKGIDSLSRFGKIVFDQKDVPLLRYLICYELIIGNFLPYEKQTPQKLM